jgi:2-dehydro-3-deoxyphosphogluconate aldolase/(4S)-4-hydroxy-2-oxoglutarate aldolase
MNDDQLNLRERAVLWTKETGVLPAMKLKREVEDVVPYIEAMVEGGMKVVEITMTTPNALRHYEAIRDRFEDSVIIASGTTLDAASARLAILSGVGIIVSPMLKVELIETAHRYGVACYTGSFTATEVLTAIEAGADMVKIFPGALAGPKYMTNLKMVYPEVNLIPSGGVGLDNAADFIKCGACAISGARNFFDLEQVEKHGLKWITEQVKKYIDIVAEAKRNAPPLP